MGKWFDIQWIGGSIYHWKVVQDTIGMGFEISWVGGRYTMDSGPNNMGMGFAIPWIGASIYHG
jgi:hypothetical protein